MTNKGPQRAVWRPWLLGWFGMLVLAMANGRRHGRIWVLVPVWTAIAPALVRGVQRRGGWRRTADPEGHSAVSN